METSCYSYFTTSTETAAYLLALNYEIDRTEIQSGRVCFAFRDSRRTANEAVKKFTIGHQIAHMRLREARAEEKVK